MSLKIYKDDAVEMKMLCVGRPVIATCNIIRLLLRVPRQLVYYLFSKPSK